MSMTDLIADMLTRIRNGIMAGHETVDVLSSKINNEIVLILKDEGYIRDFETIKDNRERILRIHLKYEEDGKTNVIQGLKRISKSGRRVYVNKEDIPRVLKGLGIAILSTNKGILTDKNSRRLEVGGEVLCYIW
ncbi:MAG: 30S ribosomal protein S8 [Nitrospinae bacterium]|nr:30S ribosomal protein S8 [Nitrospinota bacterium]